jgi:hypothetical protein
MSRIERIPVKRIKPDRGALREQGVAMRDHSHPRHTLGRMIIRILGRDVHTDPRLDVKEGWFARGVSHKDNSSNISDCRILVNAR